MPCRSDGCSRRPPQDRGRQSRPQRLSWGCRQLRPGRRADARHGGSDRSAGTDDRASPSRPKQRWAAGPRGGAGRQLDPAAIYGPFRRAGASSGRSLSHGLHNGAAAAVEPPPPRLEACTGATPDRGGAGVRDPFIHPSILAAIHPSFRPRIHQSFHPSTHLPIHSCSAPHPIHPGTHASLHSGPALPASQPARRLARLDFGDPAPRRYARGCGARSSCAVGHRGLRRAGTASAAASGSNTQGPILLGSAQPYVKSASTQQPPAHSGAERPATANNRNSVRVYYGCEPGEKKKII